MRSLIIALLLAVVSAARADINIQWTTDSYSAFDVLISGTGSWQGTITSPSGLWQLSAQNTFDYNTYYPTQPIWIGNYGTMTFLGQLPSSIDSNPAPFDNRLMTQLYSDPHSFLDSHENNNWDEGYTFLSGIGWSGSVPVTVTSFPVVTDPSTWTWTAEYQATGPSLAPTPTPVPEPGTVALVLTSLLILAARTMRRQRRFQSRLIDGPCAVKVSVSSAASTATG